MTDTTSPEMPENSIERDPEATDRGGIWIIIPDAASERAYTKAQIIWARFYYDLVGL